MLTSIYRYVEKMADSQFEAIILGFPATVLQHIFVLQDTNCSAHKYAKLARNAQNQGRKEENSDY